MTSQSAPAESAEGGIIGGTGLYALVDDLEEVVVDTPYGAPSDALLMGCRRTRTWTRSARISPACSARTTGTNGPRDEPGTGRADGSPLAGLDRAEAYGTHTAGGEAVAGVVATGVRGLRHGARLFRPPYRQLRVRKNASSKGYSQEQIDTWRASCHANSTAVRRGSAKEIRAASTRCPTTRTPRSCLPVGAGDWLFVGRVVALAVDRPKSVSVVAPRGATML